jgi:hypothetical protein
MSDNISADNTPEIASRLDAEEAFLIQEYKKAKAKLAQIREKKRTRGLGRKERATASSVPKGVEYGEQVIASPVPNLGVEHEDIITISSDDDHGDYTGEDGSWPQAQDFPTQALSLKVESPSSEGFTQETSDAESCQVIDLDKDHELADEDIGTGDPNINVDIDSFDQPSSSEVTDASSDEERDEDNEPGQNEWRMEPPLERTYAPSRMPKRRHSSLVQIMASKSPRPMGRDEKDIQSTLGFFDAHDMEY